MVTESKVARGEIVALYRLALRAGAAQPLLAWGVNWAWGRRQSAMARDGNTTDLPPNIIRRKTRGLVSGNYTYIDKSIQNKSFSSVSDIMQFYQTRVIQLAEFMNPNVNEYDLHRIQRINSSMRLGKNWFEEEKRPFQDCAKCFRPIRLFKRNCFFSPAAEMKKQKLEKVRTLFDSSDEEDDEHRTGECRVFPRLPAPPGSVAYATPTTAPSTPSGSAAAAATATAPAAAPSGWSLSTPPSAATHSSCPVWRGRRVLARPPGAVPARPPAAPLQPAAVIKEDPGEQEQEFCGICMQKMERQHLFKHLSSCLTQNLGRKSVIQYAFKKKSIVEKENIETAMVIIKKEVLDEVNEVEEKNGGP